MSNEERDEAAEAWARPRCEGSGYVQWHNMMEAEIETFKAGWDACADDVEREIADRAFECWHKERDTLRVENERLNAQVISWHAKHDAYFIQRSDELKKIMAEERDLWREQAEKLAETLKMYSTLKIGAMHWEHHDRFSHSETPAIEALAEFEAFKERIKN